MSKANLENVSKSPFIEFSENTLKHRRNLLISSCILAFLSVSKTTLSASEPTRIIGIPFENLSIVDIKVVLSAIVLYFLIYFLWKIYDEVAVWGFQLIKKIHISQSISEPIAVTVGARYDHEERKGLYNKIIKTVYHSKLYIAAFFKKNRESIALPEDESVQAVFRSSIRSLKHDFHAIELFENRFRLYSIQKLIRLAVFDVGIPVLIACYSLLSTIQQVKVKEVEIDIDMPLVFFALAVVIFIFGFRWVFSHKEAIRESDVNSSLLVAEQQLRVYSLYIDELIYSILEVEPNAQTYSTQSDQETISKRINSFNANQKRHLGVKKIIGLGTVPRALDSNVVKELKLSYKSKVICNKLEMLDKVNNEVRASVRDLNSAIDQEDPNAIYQKLEALVRAINNMQSSLRQIYDDINLLAPGERLIQKTTTKLVLRNLEA